MIRLSVSAQCRMLLRGQVLSLYCRRFFFHLVHISLIPSDISAYFFATELCSIKEEYKLTVNRKQIMLFRVTKNVKQQSEPYVLLQENVSFCIGDRTEVCTVKLYFWLWLSTELWDISPYKFIFLLSAFLLNFSKSLVKVGNNTATVWVKLTARNNARTLHIISVTISFHAISC